VYFSVVQCVRVYRSVLQCQGFAAHVVVPSLESVWQYVAVNCSVLHCVAVCCNELQCVAVSRIRRSHVVVWGGHGS